MSHCIFLLPSKHFFIIIQSIRWTPEQGSVHSTDCGCELFFLYDDASSKLRWNSNSFTRSRRLNVKALWTRTVGYFLRLIRHLSKSRHTRCRTTVIMFHHFCRRAASISQPLPALEERHRRSISTPPLPSPGPGNAFPRGPGLVRCY